MLPRLTSTVQSKVLKSIHLAFIYKGTLNANAPLFPRYGSLDAARAQQGCLGFSVAVCDLNGATAKLHPLPARHRHKLIDDHHDHR